MLAGEHEIVIDREFSIGQGTSGQWADEGTVYYQSKTDESFLRWRNGHVSVVRARGFNAFSVAFGRWVGWRPDTGLIWHDEVVWPDWSSPTLSETRWAALQNHGLLFAGLGDGQAGQVVASGAREPRLVGNLLVWIEEDEPHQPRIYGQRSHGAETESLSIHGERHFWAVPVIVDGQPWVLTHTDDRLLLYPWGSETGYVVAPAPTHRPDARQLPDGRVRVVWDAEHNVLGEELIDIKTRPRVKLRQPTAPEPERLPEGTEIDLFPFLVGESSTWPRHGDHYMHQSWDGRNLYFMKFGPVSEGSPFCDNWERLVLDGDQFYLREDRSQSGAGIYSFHPGRAYKRRMKVGEWIEVPGNVLQRYEKGSCRVVDQHALPYRLGLVEAWKNYDCGGDLGIRDVIKTSYDPGGAADTIEHFWDAKGAGWFRFQEQRQDDPSRIHTTTFNRIGGVALVPTQGCARRDLVPWPPSNQQVGMTIIEPTIYPATAAGNRLRAVCGPNPGEHWASWVEWIYRRVGESGWSQQGERRNPRDDQDHTFTFPGPGEYEIGLRWSSGQTGRQRVVRVEAPVPQPQPPAPEPPPAPSTTLQIQTNDRQHYITVSANGKATATETSADHATVQLTVVRGDDGRFALRAPNGLVGSAQPDGTFTFDRERGADWRPDGWEALRAERSPSGGESYVTDHGTRLRAVNQGGGELRHDARDTAGIDETFWPSVSLVGDHNGHVGGGATTPLPPADLDRIDGQLQIESGGGFVVNGRPVLPCFWHDGSLFSIFCQDEGRALRVLDEGAAAGFHGERSWDTLDGDWWSGLHVNPKVTANFWEKKRRFLLAHRDRGLVVFDSRGSMWPASIDNPHEYFSILGDVYNDVGPHVVAVSEWCNEVAGACPPERRDPRLMHECMDILRAKCPQVLQAGSAYTGMPIEVRLLDDWSRDIYLQHSSRGNRWFNMLEHAFSTPYEDRPKRRNGINSEPPARGHWVSAIDFPDDCDTDFQVLLALINWISRQGAVLFSSPGVRPDLREDITQIAGWREVPRARRLLPADVMRYSEIFHGGAGREFSPRRVIDAGSGRAEHAYHGPDGRFVVVGYHQDRVEPFLRDVRVDLDMPIGTKGRLIVGQAA